MVYVRQVHCFFFATSKSKLYHERFKLIISRRKPYVPVTSFKIPVKSFQRGGRELSKVDCDNFGKLTMKFLNMPVKFFKNIPAKPQNCPWQIVSRAFMGVTGKKQCMPIYIFSSGHIIFSKKENVFFNIERSISF